MNDDIEQAVEAAVHLTGQLREVRAELSRLSRERCKVVADLRHAGLSYAEIAQRLGVTRSAVQQILRGHQA